MAKKVCVFKGSLTECDLNTLKRDKNATLFQLKISGLLFKVLDRDNDSSPFQETNSTKHYLE